MTPDAAEPQQRQTPPLLDGPVRLDRAALDLLVFDKDGTLIDFDAMWAGWVVALADALEAVIGTPLREELFLVFGFDAERGHAIPGSPLAGGPMELLRGLAAELVATLPGYDAGAAADAVARAWIAPDPVASATPLTDLASLFTRLRAREFRIAIATADDRAPTLATLRALGIEPLVEALVCADDGLPMKPRPEMVTSLCARLGVEPGRCAVIGDSPHDLGMARAAGVGLSVGVLSGTGRVAELGPLADLLVPSVASLE